MSAPITSVYAAVLGLLLLGLSGLVVVRRQSARVGLGSGSDEPLERAIRVQGNFCEYVPLALVLLLVAEVNGVGAPQLHVAGGALLLARLLHAAGLSLRSGPSPGRFWGTLLTWLVVVGLALVNIGAVVLSA